MNTSRRYLLTKVTLPSSVMGVASGSDVTRKNRRQKTSEVLLGSPSDPVKENEVEKSQERITNAVSGAISFPKIDTDRTTGKVVSYSQRVSDDVPEYYIGLARTPEKISHSIRERVNKIEEHGGRNNTKNQNTIQNKEIINKHARRRAKKTTKWRHLAARRHYQRSYMRSVRGTLANDSRVNPSPSWDQISRTTYSTGECPYGTYERVVNLYKLDDEDVDHSVVAMVTNDLWYPGVSSECDGQTGWGMYSLDFKHDWDEADHSYTISNRGPSGDKDGEINSKSVQLGYSSDGASASIGWSYSQPDIERKDRTNTDRVYYHLECQQG